MNIIVIKQNESIIEKCMARKDLSELKELTSDLAHGVKLTIDNGKWVLLDKFGLVQFDNDEMFGLYLSAFGKPFEIRSVQCLLEGFIKIGNIVINLINKSFNLMSILSFEGHVEIKDSIFDTGACVTMFDSNIGMSIGFEIVRMPNGQLIRCDKFFCDWSNPLLRRRQIIYLRGAMNLIGINMIENWNISIVNRQLTISD